MKKEDLGVASYRANCGGELGRDLTGDECCYTSKQISPPIRWNLQSIQMALKGTQGSTSKF